MKNPNDTEQSLTAEQELLLVRSLNSNSVCPFDSNFALEPNVPCPVCGSFGGSGMDVYCIDDFRN